MFLLFMIITGIFLSLQGGQPIETFYDKSGRMICIERITDAHIFAQAQPIFTNALIKAYEHLSDEELNISNVVPRAERYDSFFKNCELIPFSSEATNDFFVLGAFFENKLIGYVSFDKPNEQGEIYLRQLMVDTPFWNNGIGRKLTFSPLQLFPKASCLGLVTRRKNDIARIFYKNLSFIECEDYVHEPWDPIDFIGYKKYLNL